MLRPSVEMPPIFWCARLKTRHVAQTPSPKGACDPKWPTARPSWCLRLKVRLLIHREEPLALPATELIVRHSVHSFPLRKRLPGRATDGPRPRSARAPQKNSDCLQRCVPLCKQSARGVRGVRGASLVAAALVAAALEPAVRDLMTGRELSTQPAFPDFI